MPKLPSSQKLVNRLARAQGWRAPVQGHRLGWGPQSLHRCSGPPGRWTLLAVTVLTGTHELIKIYHAAHLKSCLNEIKTKQSVPRDDHAPIHPTAPPG